MTFTCPHCRMKHRLPDGVIPPPNSAAHCKKCGNRFLFAENLVDRADQDGPAPEPIQETATANTTVCGTGRQSEEESAGQPPDRFLHDEIFPPAALHTDRQRKILTELLSAIGPLLDEFILHKGEQVFRLARGIAYFPFEIPYANGLLTWPLNYYALIATNRRLIFVNLDYRTSAPSRYIFQVPYDCITLVSKGFYGSSLIVATKSGRQWDFTTINRRLAACLVEFIATQIGQIAHQTTEEKEPSQLCPICYRPAPDNLDSCPHCLTPYKTAGIARKKSLLLPGTGNLYLLNRNLGIIEIIGYLMVWMMTVILVIIGIPGGILSGGLLVLSYHCLAAYLAGRMAAKGHIPADHHQDTGETLARFSSNRFWPSFPRSFQSPLDGGRRESRAP